jgi:hypothetical protein
MNPIPLHQVRGMSRAHARSALPDAPVIPSSERRRQPRRLAVRLLYTALRPRLHFGKPQVALRRSS